jgi:hypothetical protein
LDFRCLFFNGRNERFKLFRLLRNLRSEILLYLDNGCFLLLDFAVLLLKPAVFLEEFVERSDWSLRFGVIWCTSRTNLQLRRSRSGLSVSWTSHYSRSSLQSKRVLDFAQWQTVHDIVFRQPAFAGNANSKPQIL